MPSEELDYRYLHFWLSANYLSLRNMGGGDNRDGLNLQHVGNVEVPLPPIEEQRRIADFLDTETARLESIESRRRRQLAVLEQRELSALASLTVEDSPRLQVKRVAERITSGPRGWGDYVADEGSVFLRITNVPRRGLELLEHDVLRVDPPPGAERERTRTRVGDVLVSITAEVGLVGVVNERFEDANVNQHIALVRPDSSWVTPEWLAWQLKTAESQEQLASSSYGGTKVGLGLTDVGGLRIPVPSLAIQPERLVALRAQFAASRALRVAISQQLEVLKERRQALITAAVTGQLDVTTAHGGAA